MRGRRAKLTGRPRVVLVALGLALLVGAWIAATPPFAAPDEASHYDRALGITNGTILGPKVAYGPIPGLTPPQQVFINHDTRAIEVQTRLLPPGVSCIDGKPDLTSCLVASPNGNFPPLGYVLPAVALSVSHSSTSGLWLTRAASALQSVAFVLLAVAVLWDTSAWSLLGLLAAISPMVLFVSSVMNPSGIEITACLAFAASVLRITRAPARAPLWVWAAFAFAGTVAILSGPIGLVFAIGDLALLGVLLGAGGLRELRRARQFRLSALTLLVAGVVALVYSRIAGFEATFGISPILHSVRLGLHELRSSVLPDAVGNFASRTVSLPLFAHWIWWLLVLVLFASALRVGDRRERLVLASVAVLALAFPVLFYAWVDRFSGFGLQGREVLPPLMLIPLVAGEVIFRHSSAVATQRRPAQLALGAAIALMALFQAYAWWFSARVAAGTTHRLLFYAQATWVPPLGWLPWILSAGLGTAALLSFAANEALVA